MSFAEDLKIFPFDSMLNFGGKKQNFWKSWKVKKLKSTRLKELKILNIVIFEQFL